MTKNQIRRENGRNEFVRRHRQAIEAGYIYHHSALASGYYAIDEVRVHNYSGRFGEVITIETHEDNNRFHRIHYYVK